MKVIAIIPARYASTRFPGKPLALINGKTMIQHVYQRCKEVFGMVVVATDDHRIEQAVIDFKGEVVLTSSEHQSGTDRCAEAARIVSEKYDFDIVINVQGDEPFIKKDQLLQLLDCFNTPQTDIATLITPIENNQILFDQNKVKAVADTLGFALYFSRQTIPFQRDTQPDEWLKNHNYYLHIGMYAFRSEILQAICKLKESPLEKMEKLEQLRWLENGYRIKTSLTKKSNVSVDTPEDLEAINSAL